MALRSKRVETRSWYTSYRGELVIHAAKGFPKWAKETCEEPEFVRGLGGLTAAQLPLSVGLCVVRLLGCIRTEDIHKAETVLGYKPSIDELRFGDYSEGRYAWLTEYVRPITNQVPVKGALGLWEFKETHIETQPASDPRPLPSSPRAASTPATGKVKPWGHVGATEDC
jgi:hypothetical protein